uniref:uncharacterized protein LOC120331192 n=1 Tax=Styela clava TaxID=7725 RepID=UPI001939AAA8|nr:uncharacterized protein LOC120331192 [Styela clava]
MCRLSVEMISDFMKVVGVYFVFIGVLGEGCYGHSKMSGCQEIESKLKFVKLLGNCTLMTKKHTVQYPAACVVKLNVSTSSRTISGVNVIMDAKDLESSGTNPIAEVGLISSSYNYISSEVVTDNFNTRESYPLTNLDSIFVYVHHNNRSSNKFDATFKYDISTDNTVLRYKNWITNNITQNCVIFDKNGKWNSQTCITEASSINQTVKCSCAAEDASVFGIVQTVEIMNDTLTIHVVLIIGLTMVTVSGCLLFTAIILLFFFRNQLKTHRVIIQLGIAGSLLGRGMLPLLEEISKNINPFIPELCEVVAVLRIYFDLTAACWTLNEGVILFIKVGLAGFVDYNVVVSTKRMIGLAIFTWMAPALLVGIWSSSEILSGTFMGIDILYEDLKNKNTHLSKMNSTEFHSLHNHRKYRNCWPSQHSETYLITSVPLIITVVANLIIGGYIIWIMWRVAVTDAKSQPTKGDGSRRSSATLSAKAVVLVTWSLGAPYLVTLLLAKHSEFEPVAIMARAILLITQGPLIFFFYCVKNTELRKAINVWKNRNKLKRDLNAGS